MSDLSDGGIGVPLPDSRPLSESAAPNYPRRCGGRLVATRSNASARADTFIKLQHWQSALVPALRHKFTDRSRDIIASWSRRKGRKKDEHQKTIRPCALGADEASRLCNDDVLMERLRAPVSEHQPFDRGDDDQPGRNVRKDQAVAETLVGCTAEHGPRGSRLMLMSI
jgi:hypothetical protein